MEKGLERADEYCDRNEDSDIQMRHYLHETDANAVDSMTKRYGESIPQDRIEQVKNNSIVFECRDHFHESFGTADIPEGGRVLGFSSGVSESPHVSTDHVEIPATIYHERLHQLSDPKFGEVFGREIEEGVTENLALENLGALEGTESCYSKEQEMVRNMKEICGDELIEKAYFKGEVNELRNCLIENIGQDALDRLKDKING